jgi:hypothetical protein
VLDSRRLAPREPGGELHQRDQREQHAAERDQRLDRPERQLGQLVGGDADHAREEHRLDALLHEHPAGDEHEEEPDQREDAASHGPRLLQEQVDADMLAAPLRLGQRQHHRDDDEPAHRLVGPGLRAVEEVAHRHGVADEAEAEEAGEPRHLLEEAREQRRRGFGARQRAPSPACGRGSG